MTEKKLNNFSKYLNKIMINAKKENYKAFLKWLIGQPLTYDSFEEVISAQV